MMNGGKQMSLECIRALRSLVSRTIWDGLEVVENASINEYLEELFTTKNSASMTEVHESRDNISKYCIPNPEDFPKKAITILRQLYSTHQDQCARILNIPTEKVMSVQTRQYRYPQIRTYLGYIDRINDAYSEASGLLLGNFSIKNLESLMAPMIQADNLVRLRKAQRIPPKSTKALGLPASSKKQEKQEKKETKSNASNHETPSGWGYNPDRDVDSNYSGRGGSWNNSWD
jgi:DNA-binding transcriptional regulator YiaG